MLGYCYENEFITQDIIHLDVIFFCFREGIVRFSLTAALTNIQASCCVPETDIREEVIRQLMKANLCAALDLYAE